MNYYEIVNHVDFNQIPLNGVCQRNGNRYWFQYDPARSVYFVYDLTEQQWSDFDFNNDLWHEYIGYHCDYFYDKGIPRLVQPYPPVNIAERWLNYNKHKRHLNYASLSSGEPVDIVSSFTHPVSPCNSVG